ncbi:MAG: chemotaxis protein CheB [Hyphomicrobiales bacterium]|nr:chemotaxis protein CheB [Hyphomicrobiales bacterium]
MAEDTVSFPIVGIGASAGGVEALSHFFSPIPKNPGAAFVIVTHLSPDRHSLLHEVVARYTSLPVSIITDGMLAKPDNVYVMPESSILEMQGHNFKQRKLEPLQRERKPVDIFLSSLAREHTECGVGVILSGGDGDGTLGIKALKEHGD